MRMNITTYPSTRAGSASGGVGPRAYKNQTPLVFRGYDGQEFAGTIAKDGGTRFTLRLTSGRTVVDKLELQFAFRRRAIRT